MSENAKHFCVCITPDKKHPRTEAEKAAILNANKWEDGEVITATFIGGETALQEKVRDVALEWTGSGMANLELQFVEGGEADIRIDFVQGDGSWSHLGIYCRQIPAGQATMNFGWLTSESSEEDIRSVVLHEFGHAMGLIHEHQNPEGAIQWNEPAVIADLSGPPNEWDEETIRHNVLDRYQPGETTGTSVDATSIMMYPIPASWTLDGFSAGFNGELSEQDKEFINSQYP
jgi:serralysin